LGWRTGIGCLGTGPPSGGALATEFALDLNPPEITDEVREYAAPSFVPERPLVAVLRDLSSRIYHDFTYRSGSTTVSTGVNEVLRAREGVCQDFARLAIACLRANGLAASYVSGYLATDPPPGKERMIGIDATHAWAAVWTPQPPGQFEWLGLDPTNDQMVDERYVIVGRGRDYADVPPLRGIIYTNSKKSKIDVAVDVVPYEGDELYA
jgi:transglutaminase-like putative cysteine protease